MKSSTKETTPEEVPKSLFFFKKKKNGKNEKRKLPPKKFQKIRRYIYFHAQYINLVCYDLSNNHDEAANGLHQQVAGITPTTTSTNTQQASTMGERIRCEHSICYRLFFLL